ncbi:Shedu anti-phage system protein SduA domain-containing protein [Mesorhizobium sp. LSJC285A00]|uniref:Shedu anti-phage system protein SduA domain-containing protein n=1 Tax=Mesorhizobium sp. LSJC285A00 TaxID=1287338 RepID=UPI0004168616|nr:Shedu anti-phage system protein SduA domain-containing protein [Mesorhizobium sp. LSJC285A00]
MQPQSVLADLVSQLEAPKFAQLMRFMANLPIPRDALELPAAAYGVGDTELLVRKLGQPGSLGTWAATWVYQQAYLPIGFWDEISVVTFLKERLTTAKRDLELHPGSHSILYGSAQQKGDGYYIPEATEAFYYLATNIAVSLSDAAMDTIGDHFREHFGRRFAQFGFATPQSMAEAGPNEVRRFTLDLLNSPSSYYFVAREGRISVVPVTEHGLYLTATGEAATAATATSSLSLSPRGFADLEALVNSRATSEADLQAFFTEHPHFLLGLDDVHCEVRPHIVLASPAGTKLVPDFMVRLEDPSHFALIELKKPTARILTGKGEAGQVGKVAAQAIKQLIEYTDAVRTSSARAELRHSIGAAPFDPYLVVLIGRGSPNQRHVWSSTRAGLPSVQLVTYDFLLERARSSRARNEQALAENSV